MSLRAWELLGALILVAPAALVLVALLVFVLS
jgi:hypothetical protein